MSVTKPHIFAAAALVAGLAAPPVLAQDAQWEIINDSALTLMELYASPVSAPGWSNDILGSRALGPGESGSITIENGQGTCLYDFQFVMEDGSVIDNRTDICASPSMTLD